MKWASLEKTEFSFDITSEDGSMFYKSPKAG